MRKNDSEIRVVFDEDIFLLQTQGGISRYFVMLAKYLPTFAVSPTIIAPIYVTRLLRNTPGLKVIGKWLDWSPRKFRLGRILGNRLHALLVRATKAQIVHQTYYRRERHAPTNVRLVVTIYDMIFELMPHIHDAASQIERKRASINRADHIICISQNTRRDLLRFYPDVEARTTVVPLAADEVFRSGYAEQSPHPRPYILHVGMRRDYKNFDGLLFAIGRSERLRQEFDLVCASSDPFGTEELELIDRAGMNGRVFRRTAHHDWELRDWYHHAAVFAYPSLYEGFGIPPLEAMAAHCPVVCMNVSSIPEVCGDAAEYADPNDPDTLQAALERVALDPQRADELRTLGRRRDELFSWEECARLTADVYRSIV